MFLINKTSRTITFKCLYCSQLHTREIRKKQTHFVPLLTTTLRISVYFLDEWKIIVGNKDYKRCTVCLPFYASNFIHLLIIIYTLFLLYFLLNFFFFFFFCNSYNNNITHAHARALNRALKKNVNLHFVGRPVFIPGYNISTFEPFIIILLKFYDITSLITLAGVFSLPVYL